MSSWVTRMEKHIPLEMPGQKSARQPTSPVNSALKQRVKSASGEGLFCFFLTLYKRERESYCCGCNEKERRDKITRGAQVPDES